MKYSLLSFTLLSALALPAFAAVDAAKAIDLAQKNACLSCHSADHKVVGPAYKDVATKYKGNAKALDLLMKKVKTGGSGVWGPMAMPPSAIKEADLKVVIEWVLAGAPAKK